MCKTYHNCFSYEKTETIKKQKHRAKAKLEPYKRDKKNNNFREEEY